YWCVHPSSARRGMLPFQDSYRDDALENFRRDRCSGQPQPFHKFSRRYSTLKAAEDTAIFGHSRLLENEDVADLNVQVVQTRDFGDVSNLSRTVAEARSLNQQMNHRGHLL